jgi:hypothetical protein
MQRALRTLFVSASKLLPLGIIPLGGMLRLSQRISSGMVQCVFLRDCKMQIRGRPRYFRYLIDLRRWPYEPFRWSFTGSGVYAREYMIEGCKVLDL